jgi:hypothetical protein
MARDEPHIDWSQASVVDGRLTVPFGGEPPKKWTDRLEQVLERLHRPGQGWGEVDVGRKKLRVEEVTPGSESELRHLLESAVLQAGADVPVEASEGGDSDQRSEADQQMTETFRAFADG